MDLKAKVQEVKEYSNKKNELVLLIQSYLEKHKEYTDTYNLSFKNWSEKLIVEFTDIFRIEGFEISKKEDKYSDIHEQYKIIKATITDLEFELSTRNNYDILDFYQIKPESERKTINIYPTIKRYRLNEFSMKHGYGNTYIHHINDLKKEIERINKAEYSIEEMDEFQSFAQKEYDLLLNEINKLQTEKYRSKANSSEYPNSDKNKNYGEFDNLSELIERI